MDGWNGKDGHNIRSHIVGQMMLCARHHKANALQIMTGHTLGSTRILDSYSSSTGIFRFGFVRFSLKDI
jgi:hypothetical protein